MAGEAARVKTELLDVVVQLLLTDDDLTTAAVIQWIQDLVWKRGKKKKKRLLFFHFGRIGWSCFH